MSPLPPQRTVRSFFVVIPLYNEEKLMRGALDALAKQTDRNFSLILVDNASTDRSPEIINAFIAEHPEMRIEVIAEPQKGTGAASDTGFRRAIEHGADVVARTDADALADPRWVAELRQDFERGKQFVGGKLRIRTDEPSYRPLDSFLGAIVIGSMERVPAIAFHRRGQRYRLFMAAGCNLAIDSRLYEEVGGFPRTRIEETDEDVELHLKVAQKLHRSQVRLNRHAIVRMSIRRAKALGVIGILLWYWGRKVSAEDVDVR